MKVKLFFVFLFLFVSYLMAAIAPVSGGPSLSYDCAKDVLVVKAADYDGGTAKMTYSCSSNNCQSCPTTTSPSDTSSTNINSGIAEFKYYGPGAYNFVIEASGKAPYLLSPPDKVCYDPTLTCPKKDIVVETAAICEKGSSSLKVSVKDSLTGKLIKDATITVRDVATSNLVDYKTNKYGISKAAALEQGIHELVVDKKGYDKKTLSVNYGADKYACPDCKIEVSCSEKKVKFTCSTDPGMANKKLTIKQVDRNEEQPPKLTSAIGTAGEELTTASFAGDTVPRSTLNTAAVRSIPKNVKLNNVRVALADILSGRVTGKANNIVWKNLNTKSLLATFVQNGVKRTVNLNNVQVNNALTSSVRVRNLEITRGTAQNIVVSNRVANGAEAPASCPRPDGRPPDLPPRPSDGAEAPAGRPERPVRPTCPGSPTECAEDQSGSIIPDTARGCTMLICRSIMPDRPTAPTTVATTDNTGAANLPLPERGSYEATTEDGKIFPIDIESVCKRATDIYCSKEKRGRFKVSTLDQENSEPRPTRVKVTKISDLSHVITSFKFTSSENGYYPSTEIIITPDQCINEGDKIPGGKVDCGGLDGGDFDGDVDGGNGNGGTATNCEIEGATPIGANGQPVDYTSETSIVRVDGGTIKGENCEIEGGTNDGGGVSGGSSSGGTLSGGTPTDLVFPEEFTAYPDELEVETDEAGEVFVGPTGPEPEPPLSQPIKYDLITGDKINVGEQFTARALKNDESCISCTIVVTDSTGKEILRVTTDANGEALLSLANKGTYEVALLSEEGEVAKRKQVEAELAITPPDDGKKPVAAGDQSMLLYGIIVVVIVIVAYFIWKKKK